jgi:hypothetical protein
MVDVIRLPEDVELIKFLKNISFVGIILSLVFTAISFFRYLNITPHVSALFLITTLSLLVRPTDKMSEIPKYIFVNLPLLGGIMISVWSLINMFFRFYHISLNTNVSFILMGLTLIIPYATFLSHRFHPTQLISFLILLINLEPVLNYVYKMLLPTLPNLVSLSSFFTSWIFILISSSIIFRWPGRGFVSYFTSESVSGSLARRALLVNILIIPLIGYLGMSVNLVLSLVVLISMTALLFWINIRFLYNSELDNFLIREELRKHNVNLRLHNENLTEKIQDLEKTRQHYLENINYQDKFRGIAESLG